MQRENRKLAHQTALFQMALSTVPNEMVKAAGTKKAVKQFETFIRELTEG